MNREKKIRAEEGGELDGLGAVLFEIDIDRAEDEKIV